MHDFLFFQCHFLSPVSSFPQKQWFQCAHTFFYLRFFPSSGPPCELAKKNLLRDFAVFHSGDMSQPYKMLIQHDIVLCTLACSRTLFVTCQSIWCLGCVWGLPDPSYFLEIYFCHHTSSVFLSSLGCTLFKVLRPPVALGGFPWGMKPGALPSCGSSTDTPENCHLKVKKLPKTVTILLKKYQIFGNFFTFKWQFSIVRRCGGPEAYLIWVYDCVNTLWLCVEDKILPKDHISPLHHISLLREIVIYYA